jgi:outer membrane protein assembly factor BamB
MMTKKFLGLRLLKFITSIGLVGFSSHANFLHADQLVPLDVTRLSRDLDSHWKQERPFHVGVIRFNKTIDNIKPLAMLDTAGFVIKDDLVIGGFSREHVSAYNFKERRYTWWAATDGEMTSKPLLQDGTVFFSTRSGKFYSVNAVSGQINWQIELESHSERATTLFDGKLYVVTMGQVAYSIDAATGKRLWVYDCGNPDRMMVKKPPPPVVADGKMTFAISSGEIVALKIDDGKVAWRYNPFYVDHQFHDPVGEMLLANGKLLMSRYDGFVGQLELSQDRKVIWQNTFTSIATTAFRSGRYFVGLVSGDILSVDIITGRTQWRYPSGSTPSYLVPAETRLISIGSDGRIIALDIADGSKVWAEDLGGRIGAQPFVSADKMYVSTGQRNLYGYLLTSGQ